MRPLIFLSLLSSAGCKSGTLGSGEWGTLRYFGELGGVVPVRATDDDLQEPLVLLPPTTDRDGNIYILHEQVTKDAVIYVGDPYGGWSRGCPPGEDPLPNAAQTDPHVHGFLGTSQDMAWFWAGDALVQVSGTTGECKQVIDKDPLTLTDLRVIAATPYIHETPARRTVNAWVLGTNDALRRNPPAQVVVDLDLRRYVSYSSFQPSDATCVDVLGVGSDPDAEESIVVVAYNYDGQRFQEARYLDPDGRTVGRAPLDMGSDEVFVCDAASPGPTPEPKVLGQIQANDLGVYAGLLTDGTLLTFNVGGGAARTLPDFNVEGMVRVDGDLYVTGTLEGRPIAAQVRGTGEISNAVRWKGSERAAAGLQANVDVLDERYSPAEPIKWQNPETAIGSWPFLTPHRIDTYAVETTGWLVAGPTFESTNIRTAVAFGPVGLTVP